MVLFEIFQMSKKSASNYPYVKNILKKLIYSAESSGEEVLEDLYEIYSHYVVPFKVYIVLWSQI